MSTPQPARSPRMYTICYREGGKGGLRVYLSRDSMPKQQAVRHWQSMLLAGTFAGYYVELVVAPSTWMVNQERLDKFMRDCRGGDRV